MIRLETKHPCILVVYSESTSSRSVISYAVGILTVTVLFRGHTGEQDGIRAAPPTPLMNSSSKLIKRPSLDQCEGQTI